MVFKSQVDFSNIREILSVSKYPPFAADQALHFRAPAHFGAVAKSALGAPTEFGVIDKRALGAPKSVGEIVFTKKTATTFVV